jgi:hypothetical protein
LRRPAAARGCRDSAAAGVAGRAGEPQEQPVLMRTLKVPEKRREQNAAGTSRVGAVRPAAVDRERTQKRDPPQAVSEGVA